MLYCFSMIDSVWTRLRRIISPMGAALSILVLLVVFSIGVVVGRESDGPGQLLNKGDVAHAAADVNFNQFWNVWRTVQQNYLRGPVDDTQLFYAALQGLVQGTNDPYSVFFPPEEASEFAQDLSGKFEGIGAQLGKKEDQIVVIAPLPESPAARAGIRSGDKIYLIDDVDTNGMSVEEAVKHIRGKKKTTVVLTVAHEGAERVEPITIVRDEIHIASVEWNLNDRGIATLSVHVVNEDTARVFREAVTALKKKQVKGIVLDLRNNPGGYLDRAVSMAGEWTGPRLIVSERDKEGRVREIPAAGVARLEGIPTVVLVNGGTASAAEIFAGALQDYALATVVGEQTFGKGTVQSVEDFPDGSSLKLTIAEWLTPKGRSIQTSGITPDEVVAMTEKDYTEKTDPQMRRAQELVEARLVTAE